MTTRPQRPGTWMPSLLVWLLTVWWWQLAANPWQSSSSLIRRQIQQRTVGGHSGGVLPLPAILVLLGVLVVAGLATGVGSRSPRLRHAYYWASFAWWGFVWVIAAMSDPWSTTTGSYGVIAALCLWLLFTVARARPTTGQVGQTFDRPRCRPVPGDLR